MSEFVLNRRQALVGAAAAVGAALIGSPATAAPETAALFPLGVASGDPLPDGVVLWTRLMREAEPMPDRVIPVRWQIAEDELFCRVTRSGVALARPELAHSVHVDVRGLRPGREYFYRFRAGPDLSPVGRTKTTGSDERLRFGVVSCQDFQNGYWPAYLGLAAEDLDVVLHLGDYIYENAPGSLFADRVHTTPETPGLLRTLADYRARHAQYKSDPALRSAHAAHPFVATWDDHEVRDNYIGVPEEFAIERAAGYQAYYEHMPIRATLVPGSSGLRIYRRFDFGSLVRLNVLDTRQYRTDQPGNVPSDIGPEAPGVGNTTGTLTGAEQEAWLTDGLTNSPAQWNVVAQQVVMARTRLPNPFPPHVPPSIVNLDQWDGYQPQRERLLRFIEQAQITNPVFLAGDIHSTWINELKTNFDDLAAPPVAVEFAGTSISSSFPAALDGPIKQANPVLNPHVRYFDSLKHGYLRCDVNRDQWRTDVRVVDTINVRDTPTTTSASFVVEAGSSAIHRV